eukprot:5228921-Amphidinium_carterae.2
MERTHTATRRTPALPRYYLLCQWQLPQCIREAPGSGSAPQLKAQGWVAAFADFRATRWHLGVPLP